MADDMAMTSIWVCPICGAIGRSRHLQHILLDYRDYSRQLIWSLLDHALLSLRLCSEAIQNGKSNASDKRVSTAIGVSNHISRHMPRL